MGTSAPIIPGLWRVGGHSWGGVTECISCENDCNVYLLDLGAARVLIDCGTVGGKARIEENLRQVGVAPERLTDLLLTHSHYDHTQAAWAWQADYPLRTHLSAVGADALRRGDHRLVGYRTVSADYRFEPFRIDHAVVDGEAFTIGDTRLTAQAMPGHTPDSTLFTLDLAGRRVGICGDITFGRDQTGDYGCIGWLDAHWGSDLVAYRASLRRMLGGPPLDLLVPGHGHPVVGRDATRRAIAASLATAEATAEVPSRALFASATETAVISNTDLHPSPTE